jgi:hypothetical protein
MRHLLVEDVSNNTENQETKSLFQLSKISYVFYFNDINVYLYDFPIRLEYVLAILKLELFKIPKLELYMEQVNAENSHLFPNIPILFLVKKSGTCFPIFYRICTRKTSKNTFRTFDTREKF